MFHRILKTKCKPILIALPLFSLFILGCEDTAADIMSPEPVEDMEVPDVEVMSDVDIPSDPCDEPTQLDEDSLNGGPTISPGCYRIDENVRVDQGILVLEPGVTIIFSAAGSLSINNGGGLDAVGTDSNPIVLTGLSATRGYWKGLRFQGSTAGNNRLEYLTIEYGGGAQWSGAEYTRAGVYLKGDDVQLTIENVIFRENAGAGLLADGDRARLSLSNSRFESNDASVKIQPNLAGSLGDGLSFQDNAESGIILAGEDAGEGVTTAQTWASHAVPYRVPLVVDVAAELTLDPGCILTFGQDSGLKIEDEGRLTAIGTEMEPIEFLGQEERRGFWRGVFFENSRSDRNQLSYVTLSGGGSEAWKREEGTQGGLVVLDGVALKIDHAQFTKNALSGMVFRSVDLELSLDTTRAEDNEVPIIIVAGAAHQIGEGNDFSGNDNDYVQLGLPVFNFERDVAGTVIWKNIGIPYLLVRALTVSGNLSIEAGVQLEFQANIGIEVEGGSLAIGQSGGERTVLGPVAGEMAVGFWKGIAYVSSPSASNRIENTSIVSAGSQSWGGTVRGNAGIYLARGARSARLALADVFISKSGGHGISIENESILSPCSGVTFEENTDSDIYAGETATNDCE